MHSDRCDSTSQQKCRAKGSRKETKIKEFIYRSTMSVEHEMYDYASNKWGHQNSNKGVNKHLEAK
jgi:hypothetical protein